MTDEIGSSRHPAGYGNRPVEMVPRTNWAGNVIFGAAGVHRPESIDELRRIVESSSRIRAVGRGHSFSSIADTAGDLVRLDGLTPMCAIDSATSTVTVTSGTDYTELSTTLHRAGFALANLASIPHITIAGACATATHGSGDGQQVLAASVAAIQLIGPDGALLQVRRDTDGDRFQGSVVALGALGIATHLTLDIEPAYEMMQSVHLGIPLDELRDHLDEVFGAGYSVSVFTDWHSGEAAIWRKQRVDRPVVRWTAGRPARHRVHPVPGLSPERCTEQLGVVGPWHQRLPHFRPEPTGGAGHELQSELFLPRDAAQAAITALREIGDLMAPVLLVSEIRTVRGDDLWLSPAYGRDSVTFHFTWMPDEGVVVPLLAAIEERLVPLGARPHWGKITTVAPDQVVASYERAPEFRALMDEYDPNGKFRNDFVAGLFPIR